MPDRPSRNPARPLASWLALDRARVGHAFADRLCLGAPPAERGVIHVMVTVALDSAESEISADAAAAALGLASRFCLHRRLRRAGLPSYRHLIAWIRFLSWIFRWDSERSALVRSALQDGHDPAACYRCVVRLTGESWSAARSKGMSHWEDEFWSQLGSTLPQVRASAHVEL